MAHKNWCGENCSECKTNCSLDESIPCSPDCNLLSTDGSRKEDICKSAGCDAYKN